MEILNRKARYDYHIEDEYEAGIALTGTEIKSIRNGKMNIKDSYAIIKKEEIYLLNAHIASYEKGNIFNHDEARTRKLLMHKKEINKLYGTIKQQGLTLIPLSVYFKKGRAKIKVGLCKGKKLYDKREVAAKKEANRTIDRALKEKMR